MRALKARRRALCRSSICFLLVLLSYRVTNYYAVLLSSLNDSFSRVGSSCYPKWTHGTRWILMAAITAGSRHGVMVAEWGAAFHMPPPRSM